jgi:hypothetical protein
VKLASKTSELSPGITIITNLFTDTTTFFRNFSSSSIPDLRTIIGDWQSDQLNRRLAKTALLKPDDTALEELMHRCLPEPVRLQTVDRKIEGVSIGNLLGVKVERVPRRVFDTSTAR